MKRGLLSLVECAYRFDLEEGDWLSAVCDVAATLTPGAQGAMVYAFDASRRTSGVAIDAWRASDVSDEFVASTIELNQGSTPEEVDLFYRSGVTSGTVSEFLRRIGEEVRDNESYGRTTGAHGYPDTFGLTASSPGHRGVVINAPLESTQTLDDRRRARWMQVGAHLQTAFRLRSFVGAAFDDAEAIMEPGGELVDATGEAAEAPRRELLERAVVAIDEARMRDTDPEEALDLWTALCDGRWSLVESFDTDGRRYYLAIPNSCETREIFGLTNRERQVVAHIAQGDSNKWCAYQLGVTAGTVSKLLTRALEKLGLSSRRELIRLYHQLDAGSKSPS